MPLHGSVMPFESSKEAWSIRCGKETCDIVVGVWARDLHKLVRSLVNADTLATKSYVDIVKLVKDYYEPKPSIIVQRYTFNSRIRGADESIGAYVAALRQIAEHCEYGESLAEMLRDRLVCGVNHHSIQRQLLAEKELTFEKALDIAQAHESAEKGAREIEKSKENGAAPVYFKGHHHNNQAKKGEKNAGHTQPNSGKISCYRCGGEHYASGCKFKEAECYKCKQKGHITKKCRSTGKKGLQQKTQTLNSTRYLEDEDHSYGMYPAKSEWVEPIKIEVEMDGVPVVMEFDTGASWSIINESTYKRIVEEGREGESKKLDKTDVRLTTYTRELIPVLGCTTVNVKYKNQVAALNIIVANGKRPNLLGRDWAKEIKIDLDTVLKINEPYEGSHLKELLDKHQVVFREDLGCFKGPEVEFEIEKSQPIFHKARPVPFIQRPKVEAELDRLEKLGIISPVRFSKWAAPIVVVDKPNGSVRLCGDFKVTVNRVIHTESYPLPRIEEIYATMSKGKEFTKLDLSQAYLQIPLAEKSKQLVTINTSKGLYQFNRMPFGISSAPAIFQRCMDTVLHGCKGACAYLDDVIVTGETKEEHLANLDVALDRLKKAGLKLNKKKCLFLQPQIEFLGHKIDAEGLHPTQEKIQAIKEAPTPHNLSQLKSFLGMMNYYSRFLPNLSERLKPLYDLLRKDFRWYWGKSQERAFQEAKAALQSDAVLVHYRPDMPLVLTCDASPYGIGAVLSHVMTDGSDRPVAYASRTLTKPEKNYSQLEKEGLAVVFGVKKFHNYLYGRPFYIESDHQPLSFLFNESKGVPSMASGRIQRWALTLSPYQYSIRYKAGKKLANADALSRLPRPVTTYSDKCPGDIVHLMNHLSGTSFSVTNIKQWTRNDRVLAKVHRYVMSGWCEADKDPEITPYKERRLELSCMDGCLLWGSRVIIPMKGRKRVLEELHEAHTGSSKMKALARSYFWWPKMDAEIDRMVRECQSCQLNRPAASPAAVHPWEWPDRPWSRLHINFAGPFMGHMFIVLGDAYSKWLECHIMNTITASKTIEILRIIFSTHGLPLKVVTDNGPTFTSQEFQQFLQQNGINHITTAPYHPATNGLAERAVQTIKQGLKSIEGRSIQEKLSKLPFRYRITPHSTTNISPAELMYSRRLRSTLDLLVPNVRENVEKKQNAQANARNKGRKDGLRVFSKGDYVYVKDFRAKGSKWMTGTIVEATGPTSYKVSLPGGNVVRRHVDDIRVRHVKRDSEPSEEWVPQQTVSEDQNVQLENQNEEPENQNVQPEYHNEEPENQNVEPDTLHENEGLNSNVELPTEDQVVIRRSTRTHKRPQYLAPLVHH